VNLNNVDLNKIAVFCQIIESGNYRLASEVLNVTPSALSQTIAVLEHSLGFPLFHRLGKKLIPTESGLNLHREFRTYHQALAQAVQKIACEKDSVHGVLRIGAYLEFAKSQLAPVLSGFLKAHPQTQVKMTFETPSRLQRQLEGGRLDLCFSIFPSVQTRVIESRPVYKEELVLISPKGLVDEKPTFQQVMEAPMIEYYFNHQPIRRWIALHFKKRPQKLPIRVYASTAEMVLSLVREGAGIGVVPQYLLAGSNSMAGLTLIRPTNRKFADHIWMLEHKISTKRAIHRAFTEYASTLYKGS
jgi:LysR family cyn operon transcriptional activator